MTTTTGKAATASASRTGQSASPSFTKALAMDATHMLALDATHGLHFATETGSGVVGASSSASASYTGRSA